MRGSIYASENVLILEVLEFTSFFSFWYWVLVILVWGMSAQIILSVPFHTLQQAKSKSKEQQGELLISLQLHARRTVAAYTPNMSLFLIIMGGFLFGFCGFTGFFYHSEPLQALLFLMAPVTFVAYLRLRLARGICDAVPVFDVFYRTVWWHRFWTIFIAGLSIFLTAFWGLAYNINNLVLGL